MKPVLAALLLAAAAASAAAQEPAVAPKDPAVPGIVLPGERLPLSDVPVRASLRQDVQQEPPERFRPLDELPPQEQYPALPLLVGAYAFVMIALFGYLFSVARRLGVVQSEVERLERDLKKSGRT